MNFDNYQNYRNLGEYDNTPTEDYCAHDNTIDVGDAEHMIIFCTDCERTALDIEENG